MKKLLIFDFDGVLEDTFDWNFKVAKKRYKRINKKDYRSWFNGNIYEHPIVLEAGPMNVTEYFEIYKKGFIGKKLEQRYKNFIKKLSQKYTIVIISSISEEIIVPYLKKSNSLDLFEDVWGYQTNKSKIKKFKLFLKKYNVSKKQCYFITDTLGDILEANNVGIPSIGVTWGYHNKKILDQGKPIFIANSLEALENFLLKN